MKFYQDRSDIVQQEDYDIFICINSEEDMLYMLSILRNIMKEKDIQLLWYKDVKE
jgi:hypothetical protein